MKKRIALCVILVVQAAVLFLGPLLIGRYRDYETIVYYSMLASGVLTFLTVVLFRHWAKYLYGPGVVAVMGLSTYLPYLLSIYGSLGQSHFAFAIYWYGPFVLAGLLAGAFVNFLVWCIRYPKTHPSSAREEVSVQP